MGETVLTAKSTFGEGLVMDFAPDNTQNTILTNALNATLLTYNGNEMSLLNDMGNGRVETAYLPEGYIPMGSCEFGGIIYIVSYNPLTDKSQIGCFPSPERNLTSDELGELKLTLQGSELVSNGRVKHYSLKKQLGNTYINPGDKFAIFGKDISNWATILSDYGSPSKDKDWIKLVKISLVSIEDSGKINYLDSDLQWYSLQNYWIRSDTSSNNTQLSLDLYRANINNTYSVYLSKVSGKLALLVELERIKEFSCAIKIIKSSNETTIGTTIVLPFDVYAITSWEADSSEINPSSFVATKGVFSSEIKNVNKTTNANNDLISTISTTFGSESGNASEADLYNSKIDYNLIHILGSSLDTNYQSYINNNYTTNKDLYIIPDSNIIEVTYVDTAATASSTTNKYKELAIDNTTGFTIYNVYNRNGQLLPTSTAAIPDDVVNNYYNHSVMKKIGTINVPKVNDSYVGTYTYTIAPCMPYGVLSDLAVSDTINFADYGTNKILLNTWRYQVNDSVLTLNWGLDALLDDFTKINCVLFNFYDNLGLCATYKIEGYESYHGKFINYLVLDSNQSTSAVNYSGNKIIHTLPLTITESEVSALSDEDKQKLTRFKEVTSTELDLTLIELIAFTDTLASNYSSYTNIGLNDAGFIYSNLVYLVDIIVYYTVNQVNKSTSFHRWLWTSNILNSYYAKIQDFKSVPLNIILNLGGSFNGLDLQESIDLMYNDCSRISLNSSNNYLSLGSQTVKIGFDDAGTSGNILFKATPSVSNPGFTLRSDALQHIKVDLSINRPRIEVDSDTFEYEFSDREYEVPNYLNPYIGNCTNSDFTTTDNLWSSQGYLQHKDNFTLRLPGVSSSRNYVYYDSQSNLISATLPFKSITLKDLYETGVTLKLKGIKYNKLYAYTSYLQKAKVLESVIYKKDALEHYNMFFDANDSLQMDKYMTIAFGEIDPTVGRYGYYKLYGVYSTKNNTYSHYYDYDDSNTRDNIIYNIDTIAKEYNVADAGFVPIVLASTANIGNHADFKHINEIDIYKSTLNTYTKFLSLYNLGWEGDQYRLIGNDNAYIPKIDTDCKIYPYTVGGDGWSPADWLPSTLALGYKNTIHTIMNYFPILVDTDITTRFLNFKSKTDYPTSYTQLLGSLLGLIYEVSSSEINTYAYNNIISVKPYNEYWKADLVLSYLYLLSTSPNSDSNTYESGLTNNNALAPTLGFSNSLAVSSSTFDVAKARLLALGSSIYLDKWILAIKLRCNPDDFTNVNPIFTSQTSAIEVKYVLPYNINTIDSIYENSGYNAILRDFTDSNKLKYISSDVTSGKYYTFDGLDLVKELNYNSRFKVLESFTYSNAIPILSGTISTGNANLDSQEITLPNRLASLTEISNPTQVVSASTTSKELKVNITPEAFTLENGYLRINGDAYPKGFTYSIVWEGENRTNQDLMPRLSNLETINLFSYTLLI